MPRCPKGSRKNKKTGNCESSTSNSSAVANSPSVAEGPHVTEGSPMAKSSPVAEGPPVTEGSPMTKSSPAAKSSPMAKSSPSSATKKVRKPAKAKIYLTDAAVENIIDANMETIEYKEVSRDKMKEVLSKVYYKPRFESEFYDGHNIKRKLKKRKASADDIIDELLHEQAYALIREWGKSYIRLSDFTSSESFYSHSR